MNRQLIAIACSGLAAVLACSSARAAPPFAERAVDMVSLKGGERLLGMVFDVRPDGSLAFVAGREWCRRHAPRTFAEATEGEAVRQAKALGLVKERIAGWRARPPRTDGLRSFLAAEAARIDERIAAADPEARTLDTQLILIRIARNEVRSNYFQEPERRRILGLAWEQRLDGVEDESAKDLSDRLEELGVKAAVLQPDLGSRVPIEPETQEQWAARVALCEFAYERKPHYQGDQQFLLRADKAQDAASLEEALGKLLEGQLGDLLGQPPGHGRALEQALGEAGRDGFPGARITTIRQDLGAQRVTVASSFFARMPNEKWELIWQDSTTLDTREARPEETDRISNDPRVKELVELLATFGLDPSQGVIQAALAQGAATQAGLDGAEGVNPSFEQYVARFTRMLDGMPIGGPLREELK
jgi:hypothetical protein